jgi:hypothetical protein
MALGFFRDLAEDRAGPVGADPGDEINPAAIAAMRGHGIDLSGEFPKPWTDEIRNVSSFLRWVGQGFIELTGVCCWVSVSSGLLIQAAVGRAGGSGCLRTNRSGWVV